MNRNVTFVQVINDQRYNVTIPENRIDTIIGRVDKWNEKGKFDKAMEVLQPFIVTGDYVPLVVEVKKPKNKVSEVIEEHRSKGKYAVMKILQEQLGLNKHQAYYQTRKAGL